LIYCTSTYTSSFNQLSSKKKIKSYGSLKSAIKDFLETYDFDEIWEMNYFLRDLGKTRVVKIRLPNKTMKKGSRGGFRLIVLLNKNLKTINLLYVYPKIGPDKKGNINDDEEIKLYKNYISELKENTLEKIEL